MKKINFSAKNSAFYPNNPSNDLDFSGIKQKGGRTLFFLAVLKTIGDLFVMVVESLN